MLHMDITALYQVGEGTNKVLFWGSIIPEVSSFKYLRIIIRSNLNWADHENYALRKPWKALHNSYIQEGI